MDWIEESEYQVAIVTVIYLSVNYYILKSKSLNL